MQESLTLSPTRETGVFRDVDGKQYTVPEGWECLPPGDAGLTRRVKSLGPSWTVSEKRGRKTFSRGVWAPADNIALAKKQLEDERADPAYARRKASDARRRESAQADYVEEFAASVMHFLNFAPCWFELAKQVATAVSTHATPVGSGTVARTKRISVEERAERAVIAWLRHQTTAYDNMTIARVKGERRKVRRELAGISRRLLDYHRKDEPHAPAGCPLCRAVPLEKAAE